MNESLFVYEFGDAAPADAVAETLAVAAAAAEALHGPARVRLGASHDLAGDGRSCVVRAAGRAGADFNRLFAGLLARQFGHAAFRVGRLAARGARPREARR